MNSRFEVGEVVVAMRYKIDGCRGLFSNPMFKPWEDKLLGAEFKALTVTEHHKVAWDQDLDGEKKYDGFKLQDSAGQIWLNQYPAAAYGQVSDHANWIFHRELENYEAATDDELSVIEDVCRVIDRVQRGVTQLAEKMPEYSAQLKTHLVWLIKKVKLESGFDVKFEPIWADHPEITRAVLVKS